MIGCRIHMIIIWFLATRGIIDNHETLEKKEFPNCLLAIYL
jgi:hypothetical protein